MKVPFKILIVSLIIISIFESCKKNKYITDSNAKLEFSKDTVLFDTVFNGQGSAVRYFMVYNPHNSPIKISEIGLEKGNNSKYRLNINGTAESFVSDVEIAPEDSMFIFVDVKIDTGTDDILEEDKVVFLTNSNKQVVNLTAFGQDVHLLNDSVINSQTWTNDKPYLIINSMALSENQTLNIEAGTKIYSHRNSRIIILGTLNVNGTYEEPVVFEADRMNGHSSIFFENDSTDNYHDVAGQWGGIWLTKLSKNNMINYAEIKNSVNAIWVDSTGNAEQFQLRLHNTKIAHHSSTGIYAQQGTIFATNCEITDCGEYAVALTRGGQYEFYHCTIGNFWQGIRQSPSVYFNNYFSYNGTAYVYSLVKAYFGNCIIWGANETELNFEQLEAEGAIFNYTFENSIIKVKQDDNATINVNDTEHFINIKNNSDPQFTDYSEFDFTLKENSPAINTAATSITNLYSAFLNYDLNNNIRQINTPDMGCYEFQ